jgi:hypothetical protein
LLIWVLLIEHFESDFVGFESYGIEREVTGMIIFLDTGSEKSELLKVCCFDFEVVETVDPDCIGV